MQPSFQNIIFIKQRKNNFKHVCVSICLENVKLTAAFRTALFFCSFLFRIKNKSSDCFWKINLSFTSIYDNKMPDFVELLTITLLFCPQCLDKTINFCFACICFYKFIQSLCCNLSNIVFKSTSIIRVLF